ncbi:MAG: hypothetical protein BROFUL_01955 [Candidatus Brocadia fulgida]|jgi:hypothetical protein|uniref:Uncharacterized protein n=1 Tax=Candidatus Brocadia fulgida TaxID=380242 RepID=A0A0M2UUK0_9BACT|nr:MAG: hypothetical protein BROFUL_01955 [Candidatus Brocadia fulgida]MBV6519545.1 hypothetical protein [Candidatus Brocadia fulgida]
MLQVLFRIDEFFRFVRIFYPTEHMTGLIRTYRKGTDFQTLLHAALHDGDIINVTVG